MSDLQLKRFILKGRTKTVPDTVLGSECMFSQPLGSFSLGKICKFASLKTYQMF